MFSGVSRALSASIAEKADSHCVSYMGVSETGSSWETQGFMGNMLGASRQDLTLMVAAGTHPHHQELLTGGW